METVPALVRPHDDAASLELALIENMAREDLNPVEEARACALLVDELGLTREEIGRRVGRSRVAVSNLMRLLDLPDDVLDLLATGQLSEGHGRALLTAPDHGDRRRLARHAVEHGWSVRATEANARGASTAPVRAPEPHPDQTDVAARLADALGRFLGEDVAVSPRGAGYRVTLGADAALALTERLSSAATGD
jgi:ParB family chromosome partitioning protein